MPYTTNVAGTTITAAWANANVRDQVVTPFSTASARTSAITSPTEGMVTYQQDVNTLEFYDGTGWCISSAPVRGIRITNAGSPMYTTSGTTELDLSRYAMTALTLDPNRYYLYRALVTWVKTIASDNFDFLLRANTSLSGQRVGASGNFPTLSESNGSLVNDFLFKGDGGHGLTTTALYLSVVRNGGTGTFASYGAGTDNYRAWAVLYDVGTSVNWLDVA